MTQRTTVLVLVLAALLTTAASQVLGADGAPWIIVFTAEGCPDCAQIKEVLDGLTLELPETAVARYDISDPEALELLYELADVYEVNVSSVPVVFVGDVAVLGAGRAQEFELRNAIGECTIRGCRSPLERAPSVVFRASILQLTLLAVLFALLFWWQTS